MTEIHRYPFLVSIRILESNKHVCAGTIISHNHIITAAHCFYEREDCYDQLRINAGSSTLSGVSRSVFTIKAVHIHPDFIKEIDSEVYLVVLYIAMKALFLYTLF
jgi:V8-like Glu-specific endopeptidase